ncbi:NTP transferase domain-containing protein [Vibrio sp. WXL103]|uniref:NTP transferase domain-containing protein n=1 Tax=Vibrio sp. WXL103 TaxID=3450710 RepID=UPI003EC8BB1D
MPTNNTQPNVDCIIPAAGLSSRMGKWKLMLAYKNTTLVELSVSNALKVCSRVILVVGHRADEMIERFQYQPKVKIVCNPNYRQGMLSSIKAGLEHVRSEHFFVAHADMPCIEAQTYRQLWAARGPGSVFPGTTAQGGHPVLISTPLAKRIISNAEHQAMKPLLKPFPMRFLNLDQSSIYFDVDTPDDYQMLLQQAK